MSANNEDKHPAWLTTKMVAEHLSTTTQTVCEWIRQGRLKAKVLKTPRAETRKTWRIRREDFLAFEAEILVDPE